MAITRTPIIDDDGTGTTGTVIDNAWKTELYNQIDGVVPGGWTTYAVTWTNTGTANTLGNGVLVGRYLLVAAKTILIQIRLTFGSTTAGGSGVWILSLPFTADGSTMRFQPLPVLFHDNDFGTRFGITELFGSGGQLVPYAANAPNGTTNTLPMVWTTSDVLEINGTLVLP